MEEDNQEISGWNDHQFKFLQDKSLKRNKKKQTRILATQPKVERKLKPSYTLPVIKNLRRSQAKENTEIKEKVQDQNVNNSLNRSEKRIHKVQKISKIENNQKQDQHNLIERQHDMKSSLLIQISKKPQQTKLFSQQKIFKLKQQTKLTKQNQISNIRKLKIQASEYCSTPKNLSLQDKQKSKQLLLKLKQNFSKDFNKKSKSKYFIVKKQKISSQQASQQISKIAIQSRRSYQEIGTQNQEKTNEILKQRYKNILKTIEVDKKNSCSLLNSKSQQLSKFSNLNNFSTDFINKRNQNVSNSNRYMKNQSSLNPDEYPKINKAKKLNKILQQSQQFSRYFRKSKQKSLQMLRLSNQIDQNQFIGQISMQRAQNLSFILANRQKNVTFQKLVKASSKDMLQEKNNKQLNKALNKKNCIKMSSQPFVLEEFNDESIFISK